MSDGRRLFDDGLLAHEPDPGQALTPAELGTARAAFPAGLVAMYQQFGFGSYANRRYQFLNFTRFHAVVARLFGGDPEILPNETYVIAVEAFGVFKLWNTRYFTMTLDIADMSLRCPDLAPDIGQFRPALPAHIKLPDPALKQDPDNRARGLLPFEPKKIDYFDPMGTGIFTSLVKTRGPLAAGEIFAFSPPLCARDGVGPRHPMDEISRMPADAALDAACDVSPARLCYQDGPRQAELRLCGNS